MSTPMKISLSGLLALLLTAAQFGCDVQAKKLPKEGAAAEAAATGADAAQAQAAAASGTSSASQAPGTEAAAAEKELTYNCSLGAHKLQIILNDKKNLEVSLETIAATIDKTDALAFIADAQTEPVLEMKSVDGKSDGIFGAWLPLIVHIKDQSGEITLPAIESLPPDQKVAAEAKPDTRSQIKLTLSKGKIQADVLMKLPEDDQKRLCSVVSDAQYEVTSDTEQSVLIKGAKNQMKVKVKAKAQAAVAGTK